MGTFRHFSDIQAWTAARDIAVDVYRLTARPPISRDFGFRDQLRRAAVSVMANIAEGFARGSDADFARFLDFSRGSAAELESHLLLAEALHPTLSDQCQPIREHLDLASAMIAKLTTYLRKTHGAPPSRLRVPAAKDTRPPDFRTSGLPD
jgi:four helix bundle protein